MDFRVVVTDKDIKEGREEACYTCGCPVWRALKRVLELRIDTTDAVLSVPDVDKAKIGRITIDLPQSAIEFQEKLMDDAAARVKPFSFDASFRLARR